MGTGRGTGPGAGSGRERDGGRLVGRQRELRSIEQALDQLNRGSHQFVQLIGEPGIGKTRLLAELSGLARQRDHLVLGGRATEFEQQMPLRLMVDALDDHLQEARPLIAERLGPDDVQLLAAVFPGLEEAGQPAPLTEDGLARYRLFRAIRLVLDVLAEPAGLVLVLDDIHWADQTSIELIDHLVRHGTRGRVLVALAFRGAQIAPRLASVLGELPASHSRRLELGPLTAQQVRELLGDRASTSACERLYRASGGNPLYLEALARAHGTTGAGMRDEPAADVGAIPSAVQAALGAEVAALPSPSRLIAQAAAVVGNEFEPALVEAVSALPADEVLDALDDLAARDLVRPVPGAGRFRFRHPLVRHFVYASAAPGWRLAAHARAADELSRTGAGAVGRAHHVERSARFGDLGGVATLVEAARAVAGQSPDAAAHWLSTALRLLPEEGMSRPPGVGSIPSRVQLMSELAHNQGVSGQLVAGRDTTKELIHRLPPWDHAERAKATALCATLERSLGHHEDATALLVTELDAQPDPTTPEAVRLRLQLATHCLMHGDFGRAHEALTALEDYPGEEATLPMAVAMRRAVAIFVASELGTPLSQDEPAELIDAMTDAVIAEQLDAVVWLSWTELFGGRLRDSLRHFTRAARLAQETGQSFILPFARAGQARAHGALGELAEGLRHAEEAVELSRLLGVQEALALALVMQCWLLTRSGDHEAAVRAGNLAVTAAGHSHGWERSMAAHALAVARIVSGDLEGGYADLLQVAGGEDMPALDRINKLASAYLMARVEANRGRAPEAEVWAARAERLAHPERGTDLGFSRLARSYALSVAEPGQAAERALEAAGILQGAELYLEAGMAHCLAGGCFARVGEHARARAELETAVEVFAHCGATTLHADALRRLAAVT